jgi:hypothetical protein
MAPVWAALVLASIARQTLALHFDAVDAKNYPVSKVVALLNDMKVQLEKEQDADEEIYSKMACWCETNTTLDNTIEKMTSLSLTLNEEIKGLEKEIAANQKSLDVATALRAKQLAEFNAEEKEMLQSISALKSAVVVLGKHHDGSAAAFLNNKVILKAFATAKALQDKHMVLLQGTITPSQKRLISSLAQDQGPTSAAYKPQSGQIFGILNQMKETFEADLSNSAKEELASAAAYKDLKAAKEEEIAAGTQSLEQKTQQLATTDETNAQAKEDKEDTEASLGADQKFLMDLKERCALSDEAWEKRQKERHVELEAVAKAISILSSDDARDQFSKTYNPSFLQVSAEGASQRKQAANVLAKFPKLAALATSVRLDPFTDVKKAIDKMITALEKESAEEVKHKDYCLDGLQENEVDVQKKTHSKVNLETKIAALQQTIKETKTAIQNVVTEIEDLKTQQKRAVEDRAAEKKEFEGVVADQRETQNLLNQALDVLKDVYGDGVVLVQVGQEPPAGFDTYKKSTGSTGVIALLNQIIADTKEMEAAAMHDEQTAAEEHTKFMKATLESLKAKDDIKVDLTEQKAKSEKELTEAKSELDGTMTELENLGNEAGALHKSCDYTLKNFDVRQTARDEEVDALRKAKAFLSGMKA